MKKLLASVITLIMLVSCCIIAAMPTSAIEVNYDDWDIMEYEEDQVAPEQEICLKAGMWIVEYLGDDKEAVVPAYDSDGVPIQGIWQGSFGACKKLESCYICSGIKQIASEAFKDCAMLQEVSIPNTVYDLGKCNTFQYTSLSSIVIPGSVEEIPCCLVLGAGPERGGLAKILQTKIIMSYGIKKIKTGAFFYDGTDPLVFPSTMTNIRMGFDTYRHTSLDVYVCGKNTEVGEVYKKKTGNMFYPNTNNKYTKGDFGSWEHVYEPGDCAPIVLPWEDTGADGSGKKSITITYHGPKGSKIEAAVKEWQKNYPTGSYKFVAMSDAEVAKWDQYTKTNGIIDNSKSYKQDKNSLEVIAPGKGSATDAEELDDEDEEYEDEDEENTTDPAKKKDKKKKDSSGDTTETVDDNGLDIDWVKVGIIAGGIFLVIVAAIVVLAIVLSNKKKKKKKKKKIAAQPKESEPVIDEASVQETPEDK